MSPRAPLTAALVLSAALALACSEPPHKEMHEAQGALDAARSAGAETFAPEEYRDAREALRQSREAVTQRDYRLALRYALDARERAQEAARAAADQKAEARGRAERAVAAAEAALREGEARVQAATAAKLRAKDLAPAKKAVEDTRTALQEARAAMDREAFLEVAPPLEAAQARLSAAMTELAAAEAARPARPARRRR